MCAEKMHYITLFSTSTLAHPTSLVQIKRNKIHINETHFINSTFYI